MIHFSENTITYAIEGGMDRVEGWLSQGDAWLTVFLDNIQKKKGIEGGVAEIGVHHGKYFILLASLLRKKEVGLAIDVFEDQHLNIDGSGKGNREVFDKNLREHLSDISNIRVVKSDSLSLSNKNLCELMGIARLFSVDGCHTKEHTINDILLAKSVLADGGLIIVDDIFNSSWPNVNEGVCFILQAEGNTLVPVFVGENKLILCEREYLGFYNGQFVRLFEEMDVEDGVNEYKLKISGFDVMSYIFSSPQDFNKKIFFKGRFFGKLKCQLKLISGFSTPEEWGCWAIGGTSIVSFCIPPTFQKRTKEVMLKIYGHAYIPEKGNGIQVVDLFLNENHIYTNVFSGQNTHGYSEVFFSTELLHSGNNELKIRASFPSSPKLNGQSEDDRLLGFALRGIDIFEIKDA